MSKSTYRSSWKGLLVGIAGGLLVLLLILWLLGMLSPLSAQSTDGGSDSIVPLTPIPLTVDEKLEFALILLGVREDELRIASAALASCQFASAKEVAEASTSTLKSWIVNRAGEEWKGCTLMAKTFQWDCPQRKE